MAHVTHYHHPDHHLGSTRRSEPCIKCQPCALLFSKSNALYHLWPVTVNWLDLSASSWNFGKAGDLPNFVEGRQKLLVAQFVENAKSQALEDTNNIMTRCSAEERIQATR